jgi:uncharacterized SAM-binding protein YcdF (DUF218 family)
LDATPSDLIIVLGGDSGDRSKKAAAIFASGLARNVLITGIEEQPPESKGDYLSWRANFLERLGVPRSAVIFDQQSTNSWTEATNTRKLMKERGWRKAIVVSDPPHIRRLTWTWSRAFRNDPDMSFVAVGSDAAWWDPNRWWLNEKSAQFIISEHVKFLYYLVKRDD